MVSVKKLSLSDFMKTHTRISYHTKAICKKSKDKNNMKQVVGIK